MRWPGCLLICAFALHAQSAPEGIAYFEKNIRPLLAANCYPCHSSKLAKPMSGLLLDSQAGMLRGGKSGVPAIVPGKPDESLLIAAVRGMNKDFRMPPGKALDSREIDSLVEWIKMGAPDPRKEPLPAASSTQSYDWEKAKQHWAFRPVQDPKPPQIALSDWNRTAIDAFIKEKLDEHKLTPLPRASKPALIRRATYDLTGLPPTPEEIDKFLKDTSPRAFDTVVDRLLGSPAYGEKWGRHWLDVVRYADTAGDNADFPVPSMFRYRNWVIEAFNRDMPYNQFVRNQLAGDLLPDHDFVATGYLANSRRFGSRANEFHLTIDDTIDNLGKGMLGLSIGCARCHDHKFDPVPTADYYALYGIFKSTAYPHPGTEIYPHTYGFTAMNPADAAKLKDLETQLSGLDNRIEDMKAGKIKFAAPEEKRQAEQDNQNRLRRLSGQYPYIAKAYAVSEGKPVNARIMVRGEPQTLGPEVPRGFLTVLGGAKLPADEKGSGRLELADWVADPKNPLTARVIVNRVWEWHFGTGIVATPDDFGARGEPPTHPELLDYLATSFVEDGWSIKKLNRMIMLTRVYQTASGDDAHNSLADTKNAYRWKFNRRRLDAEEFRDSILALAGDLDTAPAAEQPFPPEMSWKYTQHVPFIGDEAAYANHKRSIYLMQQRIRRQPFLELWDGADTNAETGVRPITTTALQALYTMNDPFFHEQADLLAVRVGMNVSTDLERLNYAYRLVYGRAPGPDEIKEDRAFLAAARKTLDGTNVPEWQRNRAAWASLMRVMLSSNEFLTLD